MGMWVGRDEAADHSTPEGSRAVLRGTGAARLRGGHGGERNPALTQYCRLCQVLSQVASSPRTAVRQEPRWAIDTHDFK